MRALVVTNPSATAMSPRTRDVIVRALGSELKVDLAETTSRGHAADLAARARADGLDLVVAVGGDGTVNEVVEGLLRAGVGNDVPRLAVVPGGSANVFARALGLPSEPIEATGTLIELIRLGHERRIGLGRLELDGAARWFTFCAGFGLDAEIVREVERHRALGRRATPGLYLRAGVRQFMRTDRRHPALLVGADSEQAAEVPGRAGKPARREGRRVFLAIITNTTPWTYFGSRPLEPTPDASFESGLDLFALYSLRTIGTAAKMRRLVAGGPPPRGRQIMTRHDLPELTLHGTRPIAVQVDGDFVGEYDHAHAFSVPQALTVIAAPPDPAADATTPTNPVR